MSWRGMGVIFRRGRLTFWPSMLLSLWGYSGRGIFLILLDLTSAKTWFLMSTPAQAKEYGYGKENSFF
jgi:hypothetical protein